MSGKRFSKRLFESNDELARETAEYLKDFFGVDSWEDSENRYTIDRVGHRNGQPVLNVEVEIKQHWKDGHETFPYPDVNLPERKEKYFDLDLPTYFVIFSADCRGAVIFSDRVVKKCPKVEVPNRYVRNGELFFKIPVGLASFTQINK